MSVLTTKPRKNKNRIAVGLGITVIFILGFLLFFYLKPNVLSGSEQGGSIQHKAKSQSVDAPQDIALKPQQNSLLEVKLPTPSAKGSEAIVLYDTKSDMTQQPVDPETDPANKIENTEGKYESQ